MLVIHFFEIKMNSKNDRGVFINCIIWVNRMLLLFITSSSLSKGGYNVIFLECYGVSYEVIRISLLCYLFLTKVIFWKRLNFSTFSPFLRIEDQKNKILPFLNVTCYEVVNSTKSNRYRLIQAKAKG